MLYILSMNEKTFRSFLEEDENKSPYISVLEDEFGINPKDLEDEPQIASFFSLGKTIQNLGPYKILKFNRNEDGKITHALVKKVNIKGFKNKKYLDRDGEMSRTENDPSEDETFLVDIKELDSLLSQDFQPPPQAPGGIV